MWGRYFRSVVSHLAEKGQRRWSGIESMTIFVFNRLVSVYWRGEKRERRLLFLIWFVSVLFMRWTRREIHLHCHQTWEDKWFSDMNNRTLFKRPGVSIAAVRFHSIRKREKMCGTFFLRISLFPSSSSLFSLLSAHVFPSLNSSIILIDLGMFFADG